MTNNDDTLMLLRGGCDCSQTKGATRKGNATIETTADPKQPGSCTIVPAPEPLPPRPEQGCDSPSNISNTGLLGTRNVDDTYSTLAVNPLNEGNPDFFKRKTLRQPPPRELVANSREIYIDEVSDDALTILASTDLGGLGKNPRLASCLQPISGEFRVDSRPKTQAGRPSDKLPPPPAPNSRGPYQVCSLDIGRDYCFKFTSDDIGFPLSGSSCQQLPAEKPGTTPTLYGRLFIPVTSQDDERCYVPSTSMTLVLINHYRGPGAGGQTSGANNERNYDGLGHHLAGHGVVVASMARRMIPNDSDPNIDNHMIAIIKTVQYLYSVHSVGKFLAKKIVLLGHSSGAARILQKRGDLTEFDLGGENVETDAMIILASSSDINVSAWQNRPRAAMYLVNRYDLDGKEGTGGYENHSVCTYDSDVGTKHLVSFYDEYSGHLFQNQPVCKAYCTAFLYAYDYCIDRFWSSHFLSILQNRNPSLKSLAESLDIRTQADSSNLNVNLSSEMIDSADTETNFVFGKNLLPHCKSAFDIELTSGNAHKIRINLPFDVFTSEFWHYLFVRIARVEGSSLPIPSSLRVQGNDGYKEVDFNLLPSLDPNSIYSKTYNTDINRSNIGHSYVFSFKDELDGFDSESIFYVEFIFYVPILANQVEKIRLFDISFSTEK